MDYTDPRYLASEPIVFLSFALLSLSLAGRILFVTSFISISVLHPVLPNPGQDENYSVNNISVYYTNTGDLGLATTQHLNDKLTLA